MNMFARFDVNPAMTLQDIKETKRYGRTYVRADAGTIYAYTKALLEKNCLSSHSCHFVKKYFFLNQTTSCICSMCLYYIGKDSNCSIKSCGRS